MKRKTARSKRDRAAQKRKRKRPSQKTRVALNDGVAFAAGSSNDLSAPDVMSDDPKHCDDYIDDETAPTALRVFLERARSPAHGMLLKDPYPALFADYQGRRVRVVMASRFGDVGITTDLDADLGYQARVFVEHLSGFGDVP